MNVKLVVIGGKNNGRSIPITVPKFLIGRAQDCHLRPNSDLVSRYHCALMTEKGRVFVRDLGSRNGTILNNECLRKQHRPLQAGDKLQVGPLTFEAVIEIDIVAPKRPKVQSLEEAAARTVGSASEKQIDDELDIGDWIAETRDDSADTNALKTPQAGTIAMSTPPAETAKPVEEGQSPEPESAEEKKEEKSPSNSGMGSSIHGLKKPKSANSQDAAAETLRAFFNRR